MKNLIIQRSIHHPVSIIIISSLVLFFLYYPSHFFLTDYFKANFQLLWKFTNTMFVNYWVNERFFLPPYYHIRTEHATPTHVNTYIHTYIYTHLRVDSGLSLGLLNFFLNSIFYFFVHLNFLVVSYRKENWGAHGF